MFKCYLKKISSKRIIYVNELVKYKSLFDMENINRNKSEAFNENNFRIFKYKKMCKRRNIHFKIKYI